MTGLEMTVMGIAGTVAGMTLRELPGVIMERILLRKHTNKSESNGTNGSAGEKTVLFWRDVNKADVKEVLVDTLTRDILPVLNRQTDILGEIAKTNSAMKDGILVLVDRGKRR